MQENNKISIDQLRFYLPYIDSNEYYSNAEVLRAAEEIFDFSAYFEIIATSKGQNGYSESYNFGS